MLGQFSIARKGSTDARNVPQLILSGLTLDEAPPPPPTSTILGCLLNLGVSKLILEDGAGDYESNVFVLPAAGTLISWQCVGSIINDVDLLGSEDGITWEVISNMTSEDLKTFKRSLIFIKAKVNDGLDVDVYIIVKGKKL